MRARESVAILRKYRFSQRATLAALVIVVYRQGKPAPKIGESDNARRCVTSGRLAVEEELGY